MSEICEKMVEQMVSLGTTATHTVSSNSLVPLVRFQPTILRVLFPLVSLLSPVSFDNQREVFKEGGRRNHDDSDFIIFQFNKKKISRQRAFRFFRSLASFKSRKKG